MTLSVREQRVLRDIEAHLQVEDPEFARRFTLPPNEPMAVEDDRWGERHRRNGLPLWSITRGRPLGALMILLLALTVTTSAAWLIMSLPGPAVPPSCAGPARTPAATPDPTMRVTGWVPASVSCSVVSSERGAANPAYSSGRASRAPVLSGEPVR